MRFVVYGAGAVGGVVGGRLAEHGREVVVIARGPHLDAIRRDGLRVESPDRVVIVPVPAAGHPSELVLGGHDVVLLAVKGQDTVSALDALVACGAPRDLPVVCMQNGVENERQALRRFRRVYGMCVMAPTTHLEPGVVQAGSSPVAGLLDLGCYPQGVDAVVQEVAATLSASGFSSVARPDIMRWKHQKLLMNLGNAAEALCGAGSGTRALAARARAEGRACLEAAGIPVATDEEDRDRRGDLLQVAPIDGRHRGGGSTWQSLARGAGTVETDHLTGEIVLLGRLHGIPTPVNEALQRLAVDAARVGAPPGSHTAEAVVAALSPHPDGSQNRFSR